jgi:putative transposase
MVRAGAVNHPGQWNESGFCEIQEPPKRYAIIDLRVLSELCGFAEVGDFQKAHRQWVEQALATKPGVRDDRWTEAIAVGSLAFVEKIKTELGVKALHREFEPVGEAYALQEPSETYAGKFTGKIDIETEKGIVRLVPVGERGTQLFGQDGADLVAERLER